MDEATEFSDSVLEVPGHVSGLVWSAPGGGDIEEYSPSGIREALERLHASVSSDDAEPMSEEAARHIKLLQRFTRMAERTSRFSDADLQNVGLLGAKEWKWVWEQLRSNDLIDTRNRSVEAQVQSCISSKSRRRIWWQASWEAVPISASTHYGRQ